MKKTGPAAIAAIMADALRDVWDATKQAIAVQARNEPAPAADRADQERRAAALSRDMGRRFAFCNLDELRVIDLQLTRLELGREQYGHLVLSRARDWEKEQAEEHVDANFYRSCAVLVERDELEHAALGMEVDR
jgi:hypothetical protein